ncbi:MAG TPA: hypothetical protein VEO19_04440 [Terriglobia bacterium]|nr:hypothetical protein [Terriglobia bacterium]
MKKVLALTAFALLFAASSALAQLGATTGTTTMSVAVVAEAGLTVNTSTTTLTESGASFSPYTGTTSLTYYIRTTPSTGGGNIQLEVTTDFAPTGGPSVGSPPTGTDALKYTCTVSSPGTACTGSQTSSKTAQTPVGTFGAGANSAFAGNSASVAWSLTNDPLYKVATYTATVTFTISAT